MASADNNNIEVNLKDLKMFESLDLNGTDPTDGSLEDNSGSFSEDQDQDCKICKWVITGKQNRKQNKISFFFFKFARQHLDSPRVLSCLHVFCESCLSNILNNDSSDATKNNSIVCPDCKQTTTVSSNSLLWIVWYIEVLNFFSNPSWAPTFSSDRFNESIANLIISEPS